MAVVTSLSLATAQWVVNPDSAPALTHHERREGTVWAVNTEWLCWRCFSTVTVTAASKMPCCKVTIALVVHAVLCSNESPATTGTTNAHDAATRHPSMSANSA